MSADTSFQDWMARLRRGDEEAADHIFRHFAQRLIGLAQAQLDSRLRGKVDPEDVMQSVLKSFFVRHAEGRFDLTSWDSLWAILVVLTLRKCGHQVRRFRAARRDVQREQTLSAEDTTSEWEVMAREPTPTQAAMLAEAVEQAMAALEEDRERQILELSLQGFTVPEVSARVGRSERTVHRVLGRVRKRLERLRDEDTAAG